VLVAERKTEFGSSKSDLVRVARGAIRSEKTSFLTPPRTGTRGPEFCPVLADPQKRTFFAIFAKNTKKIKIILRSEIGLPQKSETFLAFLTKHEKRPNMALKRDREAIGQHCGAER
jgi:hypothetical protein